MHEHFRSAFKLLSGGVMSELDVYTDYQRDTAEDVGW
jgi:hypothetical protein